jgi:NAD(P)-dependent dehydrogenase (short-subunit alcohol dehydrogenase family)
MRPQATDLFGVRDRVVILTGGCGLLGTEYARALAQAGARVVIADKRIVPAEALATSIREQHGVQPLPIQVDVSSKPSVQAMIERVLTTLGQIDVLVNNAAIDPKFDTEHQGAHSTAFEDYPLSLWNESLAVNLTGMFLCAQAVAAPMLSQGKGAIINICSIYGLVGPHQSLYRRAGEEQSSYKPVAYSVTKSAVLGLTRYLATYWAGKGIRVNALSLGGVFDGHDNEFVARYSELTPLRRMADRSEYCGALIFLASDASSYMTGANLVVDGGWTAW